MAKNDKFVICATPLAQSLYNNSTIFSPKLSSVWYLLRALGKHRNDLISARKLSFLKTHPKYSATQLALSFVIKNKNISSSVFGTTNKNHLLDNIGALNIELDIALLNKFESN
jgi:aryl-alcohol dehydrogenase-like predicted oxidoreductase